MSEMREMLSNHADMIRTVDLFVGSDNPPVLRALRVALQALPTDSVKDLCVRHRGHDDNGTASDNFAVCAVIANGVETLELDVRFHPLDNNMKPHKLAPNKLYWASNVERLVCATPKLCRFVLSAVCPWPAAWSDQERYRWRFMLESTLRNTSCQSFELDMPYLSMLASALERGRDLPAWEPSYLELYCNSQPEWSGAPDELPPIYRVLDKGRESLVHLVINDIELLKTSDEIDDFKGGEFLALVDPRTEIYQVTSEYVTPGFVDELRRFLKSQPVRTLERVCILPSFDTRYIEEQEREPRRDLAHCSAQPVAGSVLLAREGLVMTDVVYALHTFEAENEDELTFEAGERIIVLERDDQYSDGWFQGRNERGEIGLFPQSYTSSSPPSPDPASAGDDAIAEEESANADETAQSTPVAAAGALAPVAKIEPAAPTAAPASTAPPAIARRNSMDETSLHSQLTEDGDEDGDEDEPARSQNQRLSDGAAHRAALAARVSQNAERDAEQARELAERRKREDEERYIQSAGQAGLIDGLQLSDESDDDEGEEPVESFLPLPAPLPAPIGVDNGIPMPAPAGPPAAPETVEERPDLRPRADTETSTYDESDTSLYANQSSFAELSQSQKTAPMPVDDEAPTPQAMTAESFGAEVPETTPHVADSVEASPRSGEMTPTHPATQTAPESPTAGFAHHHTGTILAAAGAGLAGASAAGAAAALGRHADSDPQTEASSQLAQETHFANGTQAEVKTYVPASAMTASPPDAQPATPPANASPALPHAPRMSSPLAVDTTHTTVSSSAPVLGTPVSAMQSSFSPSSTTRSTASPVVAWDALPADPVDWTVDNVVDWGQQKGFDEGILSKFVEHEITGDVLLEMDVAMLKEIDLIAFGRRVRVYNAIKELRHRTQPGNLMSSISTTGGPLSPAMTGYGPESPAALAYSPMTGVYSRSATTSEPTRWDPSQEPNKASTEPLAGLGLQDEVLVGDRDRSTLGNSQSFSVGNAQENGLAAAQTFPAGPLVHTQTTSAAGGTVEEAESSAASRPIKNQSRLSSAASSLRPRSPRRGRTSDGHNDAALQDEKAAAVAAEGRRDSKGEKPVFSMPSLPVVGRNRKPPPRVPSALLIDSNGAVVQPRQRTTLQDRARRSTRLFSSFGGSSGDKSPTAVQSVRSRTSNSTLAVGRDAPTAMSVKPVDPVTKAMTREKGIKVTDGNLMDKIGRPDHSGWMRKKGEQYNTWKMRFFVLKGTYLYYLKSEAEQRAKGVIDLTGYRVISDPEIRPGEFAFKITHPNERTHYFAAAEQITIRTWMKEILKATIFRDYAAPVVSSCDIETLSLDAAKSLSPRPPSPTQRAEIQKRRYAGTNPNTLSQKDAAILMELAPGSPYMNGENLSDSVAKRPSVVPGEARKASVTSLENAQAAQQDLAPPVGLVPTTSAQNTSPVANTSSPVPAGQSVDKTSTNDELLHWVNANLPAGVTPLPDLSRSLRSGRPIVRLLENLSGKQSGISDASFDQFNQNAGATLDPSYIDTLFSVFDYISPLASTDDISMEDMMTGNTERMQLLLERIRSKFPGSSA
ncbi:hypothetical protein JCM3774_003094 [Rhodotorula dairenensis]